MDEFRQWCRLFVVIVAAGGILEGLLPKIKTASAFKTLLSVIVISLILMPLSDIRPVEDIFSVPDTESEFDKDVLYSYSNETVNAVITDSVKGSIDDYLKQYDADSAVEELEILCDGNVIISADILISGDFDVGQVKSINEYLNDIFGGVEHIEYK